jgi:YcxB-like protein
MLPLSIQGTLNEADLLPVARYTAWNRSPPLKILFCIGCLMVLVGFGGLFTGSGPSAYGTLVLGSIYIAFLWASPKLSIKKQLKASAQISEEGVYQFDEGSFSIARPSVQVSMRWSGIHSAVEMKDTFAIFATKTRFYSIPKRFFPAEQQVSAFRDLLKQALLENGKQFIARTPAK